MVGVKVGDGVRVGNGVHVGVNVSVATGTGVDKTGEAEICVVVGGKGWGALALLHETEKKVHAMRRAIIFH
jgi:UDP-3-O-[3-hydroxymyristoyl] glucosamine N-acyltransferase